MIDNYGLWESHNAQQEAELANLPICAWCKEPIQSEFLYEVNGELICESCMDECRKSTDCFIEEE